MPSAYIAIEPMQLMFYPTSEESSEFDPKSVRVTNLTDNMVILTNAFVGSDPRIVLYFTNTDFSKQKQLLAEGVRKALSFGAGDGNARAFIGRLGVSHGRKNLDVLPELYPLWLNSLVVHSFPSLH